MVWQQGPGKMRNRVNKDRTVTILKKEHLSMYRQYKRGTYLQFFLLLITAICCMRCNQPSRLPLGDPGNGGLFLPANFEALVVADSVGPARHLAVNNNGDIYVK